MILDESHHLDEKFDAYVEKTLNDWQLPGVIISVVKDGKPVFAKGYGLRDVNRGLPPDENTLFHIASHSKPIAAVSIAMLVDERKLDWDDPVKQYIPDFEFADSRTVELITLRDILSHRAGLPFVVGSLRDPDFTFADLLDELKKTKPVAGLRERHSYTNTGYAIAGAVLAQVSGMSWEDFVHHRIFKPLGMSSSYTSCSRLRKERGNLKALENIFIPATKSGETFTSLEWGSGFNVTYAPAGGVLTTSADIANWLIMQLNEGVYAEKRLISVESIHEMHKSQTVVAPLVYLAKEWNWKDLHNPFGHFLTYGLGWFSYDYQDRKIDEHTGMGTNCSSISVVPEENLGIAVCTNADSTYAGPDGWRDMRMTCALRMKVIDAFLGASDKDWSSIFWRIHKKYA